MIPATIASLHDLPFMQTIDSAMVGIGEAQTVAPCWARTQRGAAHAGSQSIAVGQSTEFERHFSKLRAIQANPDLLMPEGADAPEKIAVDLAGLILEKLEGDGLVPSRVVATVEGGIAICFVRENIYADIECFNDGTILGAITDGSDRPVVWEVQPGSSDIAWASDRIRRFLVASKAQKNGAAWSRR